MANEGIAERVTRYLTRHVAFYESALLALEAMDFDDATAVEVFAREQTEREVVAAQLDGEQAALLKEWRGGANTNTAAREEIRALSARAGALAERLRRAYDAADVKAIRAAAGVALQVNALRRGAGMAKKFGNELQEDAGGYVDRQA